MQYPEDEQRVQHLSALLDAYAIADTGVAIAIRDTERRQRKKLACKKDCDVCCHQPDIPLYPHELVGLSWFIAEKLARPLHETVRQQLADHARGDPCPFLVEHSCAVHPVRPLACRQYNVFTAPCAPGEDPYYTRRDDVLVPIPDYTDRAFGAVLSFYSLLNEKDREKAIKLIKAKIMNLQEMDWIEFLRKVTPAR
jgi:Fe-S-cluster containining protein